MKNILITTSLLCCFAFANAQESIKSFTLKEAIDYALKNSYSIKNVDLDIQIAKKKKWETTTMGLPQIDASVDYQNFLKQVTTLLPSELSGGAPGEFIPIKFGTKQNLNATATLKQLIFNGSYLVGLQSAKVFLKVSNLTKVKTEYTIKEAVINAYGNVLLATESIAIFEHDKELIEKNLHDTKETVKNGLAEQQDADQLQITLSTLENQLNNEKRFKEIALKMFNITLGLDISTPVVLTETLEKLVISNTNSKLLFKPLVLEDHIDYKIADNNKKSSELLVKYQKSMALPSINAFVNYSTYANNNSFAFFSKNQEWFKSSLLGVSINIPIFSSLKRSSITQQAKIDLEKSEIALKETSQNIKLNVSKAKSNYQFALDEYLTNKKNLKLAESIERKESIKFSEGLSTSFNLTTAQNQLYNTQQNYLQSIVNIINTKIKLENALNIN